MSTRARVLKSDTNQTLSSPGRGPLADGAAACRWCGSGGLPRAAQDPVRAGCGAAIGGGEGNARRVAGAHGPLGVGSSDRFPPFPLSAIRLSWLLTRLGPQPNFKIQNPIQNPNPKSRNPSIVCAAMGPRSRRGAGTERERRGWVPGVPERIGAGR